MAAPKLLNVVFIDDIELRISFDNDRHHAVIIQYPYHVEQVATAFRRVADNMIHDIHLQGDPR